MLRVGKKISVESESVMCFTRGWTADGKHMILITLHCGDSYKAVYNSIGEADADYAVVTGQVEGDDSTAELLKLIGVETVTEAQDTLRRLEDRAMAAETRHSVLTTVYECAAEVGCASHNSAIVAAVNMRDRIRTLESEAENYREELEKERKWCEAATETLGESQKTIQACAATVDCREPNGSMSSVYRMRDRIREFEREACTASPYLAVRQMKDRLDAATARIKDLEADLEREKWPEPTDLIGVAGENITIGQYVGRDGKSLLVPHRI